MNVRDSMHINDKGLVLSAHNEVPTPNRRKIEEDEMRQMRDQCRLLTEQLAEGVTVAKKALDKALS